MVKRTRWALAASGALAFAMAGSSSSQAQNLTPTVRVPSRQAPGTVLPGFSRQGGIGTTPFLGNTQGMGAYSTNFDRPRAQVAQPQQTPGYQPATRRRWFRNWR